MSFSYQVDICWWKNTYENMITNGKLADLYESNADTIGVEFCQDEEKLKAATGSTDMGNVSHVVPSIHPMFYIGGDAANHTRDFTGIAGTYYPLLLLLTQCLNLEDILRKQISEAK